jgi:hypothetical protein
MSTYEVEISRPEVISETLEGEAVIINLGTGTYFSLNPTASLVWGLLETGSTRAAMRASLLGIIEVDAASLEVDLERFLGELESEALVRPRRADGVAVVPGPVTTVPAAGGRLPYLAPVMTRYTDVQELLLMDPIHEVDEAGWPEARPVQEE